MGLKRLIEAWASYTSYLLWILLLSVSGWASCLAPGMTLCLLVKCTFMWHVWVNYRTRLRNDPEQSLWPRCSQPISFSVLSHISFIIKCTYLQDGGRMTFFFVFVWCVWYKKITPHCKHMFDIVSVWIICSLSNIPSLFYDF